MTDCIDNHLPHPPPPLPPWGWQSWRDWMTPDEIAPLGRNCPCFVTLFLIGWRRSRAHLTVVAASSRRLIYNVSHSSSPERDLMARVERTASKANLELLSFAPWHPREGEIEHLTNGAYDPPASSENEFWAVQQHFSVLRNINI